MRVFACLFAGLLVLGADSVVAQVSEGTVRGRVVDEDAGEPVGRANVLVPRRDGRPGTSTDENGHYQISLPPGEYILEVSALRYHGIRRTIALEEGETVRFDLELSPRDYSLNEIVVSEEQRAEEPVSTVQHVEYATLESQDAASVSELAELVPATHVQNNSRGQTIWYFRNAGDRQVGQFFDGALLNIPWDNRVNNTIGKTTLETESGRKVKRINLRGARVYGVESSLSWQTTDALRLNGNVMWSRPRSVTEEETQKLDEKPGWLATGVLNYELPFGLSLMGKARYTGHPYVRLDRVTGRAFGKLPSALVLDARLAYRLSAPAGLEGELYAHGENLTDEVQFIGLGLPRPGRSLRVGLEVHL